MILGHAHRACGRHPGGGRGRDKLRRAYGAETRLAQLVQAAFPAWSGCAREFWDGGLHERAAGRPRLHPSAKRS